MKRIFKRVSAAVMALAVAATAVVFDVPGKIIAAATADHTNHAVCGDTSCTEHTTISDWTGISDFNSVSSGNYYLTADVTLTDQVTINAKTDITLCLNGHTITAASNNRILNVTGGSITLCDCKGTGKLTGGNSEDYGGGVNVSNGTFTMYGGTISDNTSTRGGGGGVYVSNGTFTMYGGTISGNTSRTVGGGVYAIGSSSFTMYGGTISGNTARTGGGGVYQGDRVIFTMYGGAISDNTLTAGYGGGVYAIGSSSFTMNGGIISGNTAVTYAGGVCIDDTTGTFTMNDGTISGNTANNSGGGVYLNGTFTMNNGTISDNTATTGGGMVVYGTVTLNGKVDITGNKKRSDGSAYNVYLYTNKTLTIGDDFSTDSKIGVITSRAPTDCLSGTVAVTGAVASDISGSFTADKAEQAVVYKDNTVRLALHTYSDDWSSDDTNHWHECTSCDDQTDIAKHTFTDKSDETNHWQECTSCGDKTNIAEHTFTDKSDDTNHWQECSECGYQKEINAHSWGDWSLATEPTLTTTGTAERTCSCGEKQTKTDIPKLTDTTVWTKGIRTEPTLNGTGSQKYTSTDYGTVTITIPKLTDTTVWTKGTRTEPTLNGTGSQKYTSTDYGTVTITIPKLTDTTVWTKGTRTEPTLNGTGSQKYTSTDYGTVTITIPKLTDTTVWTKGTRTEPTLNGTGSEDYTSDDYGTVTMTIPALTDSAWTKDESQHVDPTEEADGKDVYISTDYGTVTVVLPQLEHTHEWDEWTITTEPTLTATGTAQRVCTKNDTHIDTTTLPALTDTSVWSKVDDKHVDPTEEADGKDVYTSEYGEVTVVLPSLGHTHEWGGWTITIEPSLTATGAAQRVCTKNDTHIDTTTLPALTDTSVWTKVDDKHVEPTEETDGRDVYTSEYGEVTNLLEKLPHTHKFPLTYVPEVKPTEEEEGVKEHWHCDGCGKDFEDENGTKEVTADDLKIGNIETEVQAPANIPKPEIATSKDELIAAALTEDEQQKIKDGTGVKIILKVENATENVSAEDKEKVEAEINGLSDYNLGQYLDITLLKKIGEDQEQKITETNAPIMITFELSEGLRGKAEYSVIRVHNGTATVLRDLDSAPDTVTIETDKFSTYALTYKEKTTTSNPSGDNSSGGNPGGSSNPSTSTPNESDNSDVASSGDNGSDSSSDTTSSGNGASTDESNTNSSGGTSSSDESNHAPSESSPSEDNGNPSTGIAVSLIPLVTAAAILTVAVKLKKK